MRHGTTCPQFCSQCLGYPARIIANEGPVITIDAQPTERTISGAADEARRRYARRGGKKGRRI